MELFARILPTIFPAVAGIAFAVIGWQIIQSDQVEPIKNFGFEFKGKAIKRFGMAWLLAGVALMIYAVMQFTGQSI